MALEIFKLVGSIMVDNSKANESLSKTDEKAQGVGKTLASGIGKAAAWGAAAVGAGAAAVGAMTKAAESTAAQADQIDKMSQKLGISRQSYQELDFVMSQSGTSIDSMQGGMKSLLANMDKVSEGNKTAAENFAALGVAVRQNDGTMRSQESVFNDTIRALQEMPDGAEKARLAQELFGKSGQELMPLLNAEAGSLMICASRLVIWVLSLAMM